MLGHESKSQMKFFIKNFIKWDTIYKETDNLVEVFIICLKVGEESCNSKNNVIKLNKLGDYWVLYLLGRNTRKGKRKYIFIAINNYTKYI